MKSKEDSSTLRHFQLGLNQIWWYFESCQELKGLKTLNWDAAWETTRKCSDSDVWREKNRERFSPLGVQGRKKGEGLALCSPLFSYVHGVQGEASTQTHGTQKGHRGWSRYFNSDDDGLTTLGKRRVSIGRHAHLVGQYRFWWSTDGRHGLGFIQCLVQLIVSVRPTLIRCVIVVAGHPAVHAEVVTHCRQVGHAVVLEI